MRLSFHRAGLAGAAAAVLAVAACGSAAGPSATPHPSPSAPATASATPSTPAPATPGQPASPAPAGLPAGYQPLYPFSSLAAAQAWESSYREGGHQPWHRSAELTATAFAAWLGFTGIDQVAHQTISGGDAHVAVGYTQPGGKTATAAVVHLVKFGTGQYAPWEVVGTDDTTFTLDVPAYASTVSSPVKVGGTITGVDENIRVQVRTLTTEAAAGVYCCKPAGGTNTPWSATVAFHAASGQVLTIAAATGGHVAAVERFAVTGIRAG